MQSNVRSSEGKEKTEDGDYVQSFASLNLSDSDDLLAPPQDSDSDSYRSPHEQLYTGNDPYTGFSPLQPSAACDDTPGHSSSYPTTTMGGYEYQSVFSGHLKPESDAGGSMSEWSDAASFRSAASSVPSAQSAQTGVNKTIYRQRPPNERYELPCEFHNLTGCEKVFPGDDEQGWMTHIESHLEHKFPVRLRCWFCSEHHFDARETSAGSRVSNFRIRMQHIRNHIVYEGYGQKEAQQDGHLVKHLFDCNLIDGHTYERILTPTTVPPLPGSHGRHSSHRTHRTHKGHPRLFQDEEEVAESSSRHRRKTGGQMLGTRPARSERSPKRVRGNREVYSELASVPAVVYTNDAVPKPLGHPPSSPYSSRRTLENIPFEGSSISTRDTAREHSEDQGFGGAGDKNVTNTVVNELHQIDTGFVRRANGSSSARIEPPQSPSSSQDHSIAGPSGCLTDTSSLESGSFWFTEYSEEDDKRLDEDHPFIAFKGLALSRVFEAYNNSWRGNRFEQDIPCDGVDESGATPNKDKGKGKELETGKRKWAGQSESNEKMNNSSGSLPNRVVCSKRRRTSDRQLTFACPYTKKDPMSYRDCYKYTLSRIRDVKQHLARCHRNPPYCPRCMGIFQTEEERDGHIREFSCPSRPPSRLDGITESQGRQLSKKSAANTSPEEQWYVVFDIVFPGHKPRPQSPYVDRELLQDITHYQDFLTSHGPRILSEVLEQRGVITWNYFPNDNRDLAAFQQTVFEEGLGRVFEQWLARRNGGTRDRDVPSSSGSNSQNTPRSSSHSRERAGSTSAHGSGAIRTEDVGTLPDDGPVNALPHSEEVAEASTGQITLSEALDETFSFDHGDFEVPAASSYDVDELMRQIMDDDQANSGFQPGLG